MKTSKTTFYTIAIFLWMCCGSCSRQLDVSPTSVITTTSFWQTEDDANGALTGMYISLRDVAVNIYRSEIRSDVYEGGVSGTGGDFADIQGNTLTPTNPGHPGWAGYYRAINDANLILKYVPEISFTSEAAKQRILAEAYTTRAYMHYIISKTWGDAIIRDEPIESSSAEVTQRERSPQTEVFAFIKQDLEQAIALFPDDSFPSGRMRWSRAAANAVKADVNLFTGKRLGGGSADFSNALAAIEAIEGTDTGLLPDFADIFRYDNKGNRELLMVIHHDVIEGGLFLHFTWFGSQLPANVGEESRNLILPTGNGIGLLVATQLVRNQFSMTDSRRDATFHEVFAYDANGNATYYTNVNLKFSGIVEGGTRYFTNDAILYRYADVLLMKAEAKNALGQDPSVEMNEIRRRAFGSAFNNHIFVNGSQEENETLILRERLLELLFEGKRWDDLVRYGKVFDIVPNLQSRRDEQHLLLFPIGNNILNTEPLVVQNPGYE
ncbi:RagB/SusD family nutrient uptake outer membrane protein [Olivibacter sp. SDN3]|nr:RagB/SusD family nutrient uptake outer membrane protein [Olivibacter sp. SDN3]